MVSGSSLSSVAEGAGMYRDSEGKVEIEDEKRRSDSDM